MPSIRYTTCIFPDENKEIVDITNIFPSIQNNTIYFDCNCHFQHNIIIIRY